MMRPANELSEVYLYVQPVDFRKGMMSLAALVEGELGMNPFDARLFVFTNRHRNRDFVLGTQRLLPVAETVGKRKISLAAR